MALTIYKKVEVKCPFCGFINQLHHENVQFCGFQTFFCDPEGGGCDKQFAFSVKAEIDFKVKVAKIEPIMERFDVLFAEAQRLAQAEDDAYEAHKAEIPNVQPGMNTIQEILDQEVKND